MSINIDEIRSQFPILKRTIHDKPFVYFDNGATTLKPLSVSESTKNHYEMETSNIHRGLHFLSEAGTIKYEETRNNIKEFLNARYSSEIIFTSGTTDSLNLLARSLSEKYLKPGDEIIITQMEHHSNIVPWQLACERTGAKLKVIPINDKGELLWDNLDEIINEKTKLISFCHISNSLGTINPVKEIISKVRKQNSEILISIDGAQAVAHQKVDVQDLDCDFYSFSAHKLFGPTGVGVLYGKESVLDSMPPYRGGGDMIDVVTFEKTTYNDLPYKFEAGTPNIAGFIAFNESLKFVNQYKFQDIQAHEDEVLRYATEKMQEIDKVRIIGTADNKCSILSFVVDGLHPHDLGTFLDQDGIAIRTGHHCTQPIMEFFKVPATARASFSIYNTKEEVDQFMTSLEKSIKLFT